MSVLLTYMAVVVKKRNNISFQGNLRKENYMASEGFHDRTLIVWRETGLAGCKSSCPVPRALMASSVFEGERVYSGNIFKLRQHTERLIKSAEILGFEIPYSADEIDAACIQACEANGIVDGYVRPVAWRGSEMMGVSAQDTKIHLAIAVWPWPSYFSPEAR